MYQVNHFFVMVFLAPIVRLSLLLIITKVKTIIVQLLCLNPTTVMVVLLLGLWLLLGCDNNLSTLTYSSMDIDRFFYCLIDELIKMQMMKSPYLNICISGTTNFTVDSKTASTANRSIRSIFFWILILK